MPAPRPIDRVATRAPLRALAAVALGAVALAGCVREVVSGEDPEARRPSLSGNDARDQLIIDVPWMQTPAPRLLEGDKLTRSEVVFARTPDKSLLYTLRSFDGKMADVEVFTKKLPDDGLEFTYRIKRLPAGFGLDTVVPVLPEGSRPAAEVWVNGAPVKITPGTEVVAIILARDHATKIVVRPKPVPAGGAPATGTAAGGAGTGAPPKTK